MTTEQRSMHDVLHEMEDPIHSIERASDTLELVALNEDLNNMAP